MFDVALDGRRLEERLRRDAATVQAGAAERIFLDEGHLQAGGRGVQRGGIPTRATADDDEIERITHGRHGIAPTNR